MSTLINQVQQYISNNQLEKALNLTSKLLADQPENLIWIKFLSHIYGLKENFQESIKIIEKAITKHPDDFDLCNNLGFYFFKIADVKNSKKYIKKAMEIDPSSAAPYHNSAELHILLRDFNQAEKDIDRCIKFYSENIDDYHVYGSSLLIKVQILIAQKKSDEACHFIIAYLNKSFHSELFLQLVQIDKSLVTPSLLIKCQELVKKNTFHSHLEKFKYLVPLYFALANYYEKTDEVLSDEFYVKANKEIFSIQRLNLMAFQRQQLKIMNTFDGIKFLNVDQSNTGSCNIFIVGQPRSGTTLLESLVTANEEVFPGGELSILSNGIKKFLYPKENLEPADLKNVGEEYEKLTSDIKGPYAKIVDKFPANSSYVGYILKCLPQAKIILLLRNPWDVAISLFKQRYVTNISYSSSFFNIGVQMANFEASLLYYRQKSDLAMDNILEIRYEDLVSDIDHKRQEVYNFCQISSSYDEVKREGFFAKTASMNQVQKKIHQKSLKKNNFISFKDEFVGALQSQRNYWRTKSIDIPEKFFGYSLD